MKKLFLSIIAAIAFTSTVMAQGFGPQNGNRPNFDPAEMAKNRTEQMVQKYGLNEQQATQLKALNEKQFSNFGQRRNRGERPQVSDSTKAIRRQMQRGQRRGNGFGPRGGFANEEYSAELKKILTEEQFAAYEKDMQEMRKNFRNFQNR